MVTHNSINQKSDTFIVTDDSGNTITNTTATGIAVTQTSGQYGVAVTNNGNTPNGISLTNTTSGTGAGAGINIDGNGGRAGSVFLLSPGYTAAPNLTNKLAITSGTGTSGVAANIASGGSFWIYAEDTLCAQINQSGAAYVVEMSVNGTISGDPRIRNQYDDGGALAGPFFELYRNSSSPAASDLIGQIQYQGNNTTPAKAIYATSTGQIDTATAGSEDASWRLATMQAGALTNQIVALKTGCQIRGNNTNTVAPAGYIGEVINGTRASGSALTLTTGTDTNITSVSLTAGNWQISGCVEFAGTLTGISTFAGCSGTSATLGASGTYSQTPTVATATSNLALATPSIYVSLSTTTTYYLIGKAVFTVGTATAWGQMNAVRIG